MKKLPIGMQDITKIISGNYIYVDKTDTIYKLINGSGEYYFLSRPRRFGKTLLVSTLKAIFSGNKELFKDCHIYSTDYPWPNHPILHLDFSRIANRTTESLESALLATLDIIADFYKVPIRGPDLQLRLTTLIMELSKKDKVVVLVDEYDCPFIDNLDQIEVAKQNRILLSNFYRTLKGLDEYIRFLLITGISKFSQVSLFSGVNNLNDITTDSEYSTLLGYTQEEIERYFGEWLRDTSQKQQKSLEEVMGEIRYWYNGYSFSKELRPVYNPYSTLLYFSKGLGNYWFASGTTTLLIHLIAKQSYPVEQFDHPLPVREDVLKSYELEQLELIPLMWQTGYLAIKNYDSASQRYYLSYPNEEVRTAFARLLFLHFSHLPSEKADDFTQKCVEALDKQDYALFLSELRTFFAGIPYHLHVGDEKYYHTLFWLTSRMLELETRVEEMTNIGRIDQVLNTQKALYILEFKIDASGKKALKQIEEKKYYEKFLSSGKNIVLMGINFDTKKRNITDYALAVYSPEGQKLGKPNSFL